MTKCIVCEKEFECYNYKRPYCNKCWDELIHIINIGIKERCKK